VYHGEKKKKGKPKKKLALVHIYCPGVWLISHWFRANYRLNIQFVYTDKFN